MKTDQIC